MQKFILFSAPPTPFQCCHIAWCMITVNPKSDGMLPYLAKVLTDVWPTVVTLLVLCACRSRERSGWSRHSLIQGYQLQVYQVQCLLEVITVLNDTCLLWFTVLAVTFLSCHTHHICCCALYLFYFTHTWLLYKFLGVIADGKQNCQDHIHHRWQQHGFELVTINMQGLDPRFQHLKLHVVSRNCTTTRVWVAK